MMLHSKKHVVYGCFQNSKSKIFLFALSTNLKKTVSNSVSFVSSEPKSPGKQPCMQHV